jgi:imidazolonepropionase-like amidohydrolase
MNLATAIGWLRRRSGSAATIVTLAPLFLYASIASAHDQIPGAPQTKPILIRGALVHTVDGPDIEGGSVLFIDGSITAVGKSVDQPEDALVIDGSGLHVYPGLFESVTDLGLREISAVDATDDRTEFGRENPNARAWVAVNPDSELIPVARAGGVLVAMAAPRGRWLRGQGAVLQLDGWTVSEMTLLAPAGLYVDWSAVHPRSDDDSRRRKEREEKLAEFDALIDEVRRYAQLRQTRPNQTPTNVRLESLLPLVEGDLPLIVDANRQSEIESAVTYGASAGLRVVIYGGYDAERCASLLKRYEVPVIIASTYRLPLRRDDPYDASYTLPERLRRAGVKFAIGGPGAGSPGGAASARNLPYHAAVAAAYGLPASDAVRSITLAPAEILGIADRIGSITVGKDATLLITDGDILETETHVTDAYIQGRKVDLGSRHKMLYEKYKQKYK